MRQSKRDDLLVFCPTPPLRSPAAALLPLITESLSDTYRITLVTDHFAPNLDQIKMASPFLSASLEGVTQKYYDDLAGTEQMTRLYILSACPFCDYAYQAYAARPGPALLLDSSFSDPDWGAVFSRLENSKNRYNRLTKELLRSADKLAFKQEMRTHPNTPLAILTAHHQHIRNLDIQASPAAKINLVPPREGRKPPLRHLFVHDLNANISTIPDAIDALNAANPNAPISLTYITVTDHALLHKAPEGSWLIDFGGEAHSNAAPLSLIARARGIPVISMSGNIPSDLINAGYALQRKALVTDWMAALKSAHGLELGTRHGVSSERGDHPVSAKTTDSTLNVWLKEALTLRKNWKSLTPIIVDRRSGLKPHRTVGALELNKESDTAANSKALLKLAIERKDEGKNSFVAKGDAPGAALLGASVGRHSADFIRITPGESVDHAARFSGIPRSIVAAALGFEGNPQETFEGLVKDDAASLSFSAGGWRLKPGLYPLFLRPQKSAFVREIEGWWFDQKQAAMWKLETVTGLLKLAIVTGATDNAFLVFRRSDWKARFISPEGLRVTHWQNEKEIAVDGRYPVIKKGIALFEVTAWQANWRENIYDTALEQALEQGHLALGIK